jgi:kynurenine formamidase
MCLPACTIGLAEAATRRQFLRRAGVAACAMGVASRAAIAQEPLRHSFQRVVDLTHTLGPDFPMTWPNPFEMERTSRLGKDKWNAYRWHIQEHSGTHIDSPLHCTDGPSADRIPADDLVGPLVVVDIRDRAATNPDAQLTPDDLAAWERRHGPIPNGAIVAMLSGWDTRVGDPHKFFGLDVHGGYHSPGFHVESVQFLHEHRNVKGIAVDTMSLDPGNSADFPVHHFWLGNGKWGLENIANLAHIPPSGTTIIVGAPKIAGCTGGPSRVLALA